MRYVVSIIIFLTSVAAVQFYLLYAALKSSPSLYDVKSYEKGLVYEQTLEELRAAAATGYNVSVDLTAGSDMPTQLLISFSTKDTSSELPFEPYLEVKAKSAFFSEHDLLVQAHRCGPTSYCANVPVMPRGLTMLDITTRELGTAGESTLLRWRLRQQF